MRRVLPLIALTPVITTPLTHVAGVISIDRDQTVGYGAGGVAGVMVDAALGGLPGATAGGTLGALGDASVQQTIGLSKNAYIVCYEDSTTERLRSPNAQSDVDG